ncbi:hypothetical protein GTA08_BOTSDO07368 [Neofusicoccum parvum]|uniref:Uncharacterized protein n=1 Tax=Neofusicoccum parvum TaxID=310453 RepID=A0ACB5SF23_9PEZI|nr:hypothetical protein GTA08_BOTSDO07368 [Neofusicoccum parvum]
MDDTKAENLGPKLLALSIIIVILAALFVGSRFYARYLKGKIYWWDDWTALAAVPFVFACCGINGAQIRHGLGRHVDTLSTHDADMVVTIEYAFEWIYPATLGIIKISVLLLYYRVFGRTRLNVFLWLAGAMAIAWVCGMFLSNLLQCTPMRKAWEPTVSGHCFDSRTFFIANSACNISNDVIILSLPIPILWAAALMPIRQKVLLTITFLLGALVVAASVYRFVTLLSIENDDITWTFSYPNLWSVVEPAVALISCCLPTMNVLYIRISRLLGISHAENDVLLAQPAQEDSAQTDSTIERRKRRHNAFAQWGHVLTTFRSEVKTTTARTEVRLSHGSGWNDLPNTENGER